MTDPLITWMKKNGVPLTRDAYLALAYPEGEPDEWSAEEEAMLPRFEFARSRPIQARAGQVRECPK